MEPSSARDSSDVTSTPKAHSPASSRCPLLSPISPHSPCYFSSPPPPPPPLPASTNIWLASAEREAPDSGFGSSELSRSGPSDFGQHGFGSSGFGQPGFGASGFGSSGFGASGFGSSGFGQPGFGASGFGSSGFGPSDIGQSSFGQSSFGPFGSALSFAEGTPGSAAAGPLTPLSIVIPPPLSAGYAPSEREVMFRQLDANFARFLRFAGRAQASIGAKVGLPSLDIISALLDSEPSGFILRSALLPLLSPCDLRRMRLVSSRWRVAVSRHSRDRWRRRRIYHSGDAFDGDENACPLAACCSGRCDADCSTGAADADSFLRSGAMRTIQPTVRSSPEEERKRTPTLREKFESASCALLSSERLARCPSCSSPARVSPRGRSSHCDAVGGCGAVLCRWCGYPQHLPRACRRSISPTRDPPPPPPSAVTSPEKRQRRRLLKRLSRDM